MNIKESVFYILIFVVFVACQAQDNTPSEKRLKDCVNETVNAVAVESYGKAPFDFYKFILEVEHKMIADKVLKDGSAQSYLDFFNRLNSKPVDFNENYADYVEMMEEKGFGFNLYTVNNSIFNQCPYTASLETKNDEGRLIYKQGVILNKMMEQGYESESLFSDLITVTDKNEFKNIVYRAPIILITLINLDNQYNPENRKMEEYKEGKDFLKRD